MTRLPLAAIFLAAGAAQVTHDLGVAWPVVAVWTAAAATCAALLSPARVRSRLLLCVGSLAAGLLTLRAGLDVAGTLCVTWTMLAFGAGTVMRPVG
jgi:hypothetical protein